MELLVELIFDILAEGFVELTGSFMPNKKLSKKAKNILTVIFAFIGMAFFLLLIVGSLFLLESEGKSVWGWIFVGISIFYLVLSVILKIVSHIKKNRKL